MSMCLYVRVSVYLCMWVCVHKYLPNHLSILFQVSLSFSRGPFHTIIQLIS